jgi:hypothetical protein
VARVREGTIPTKRPPLLSEVSANLLRIEGRVSSEVQTEFLNIIWKELTASVVQCQSSWLQIQRSGFDSLRYQIFREEAGLEQGPLSLVNTRGATRRNTSGSGVENQNYCRRDPSSRPRVTLYPQKLTITSLKFGSRLVGIVRSRTKATEFVLFH